MTSTKHVIVGGVGNLGRCLQKILLDYRKSGTKIVVLDRPESVINGYSIIHHDIEFIPYTLSTSNTEQENQLTEILHNAETVYSVVTPDVQFGTIQQFEQTNYIGLQQLVDACKLAMVPKLVMASSIAVTSHMHPSIEQNENDPLPTIDTYQNYYDRTKRLGEDHVLSMNCTNLQTTALRLGGLLASPKDYLLRRSVEMGEKNGTIYTVNQCAKIDVIGGTDAAMALFLASEKIDHVAGQALFVTKCRDGVTPAVNEIAEYFGSLTNWPVRYIPRPFFQLIQGATYLQHKLSTFTASDPTQLLGIPTHQYMEFAFKEQTFDNSKVKQLLEFQPSFTWKEALEQIVDEYEINKK